MSDAPSQRLAPAHRRATWGIFALLAGLYLFTSSGHTYSIDEELMFGVTESLALRGTFALDTSTLGEPAEYSTYGPGQSLVALPFYMSGWLLALPFPDNAYAWVTRAVTGWLNAFATAGTGALLYLAAVYLRYSHRVALGTAAIYGLATLAWHYSKTFFAEPLTALLLFASFVVTLAALPPGDIPHSERTPPRVLLLIGLAGVLAGLAPTVKIQSGIALPLLGIYVLLATAQPLRHPPMRRVLGIGTAWGAGALLALGMLALFQWTHYGNPLSSGYGSTGGIVQHMLERNPWTGIYGQTFSSGKGIFWFAPPLLLLPAGMWLLWRRAWRVALLCVLMGVVHVVFFAHWIAWHGAGAWGPRFLVMALPFLVLPLAAFLDTLRSRHTPARVALLVLTLLLAVPVQVGGVTINYTAFKSLPGERSYFRLSESVLVVHLEMAAQQLREAYTIHAAPRSVGLTRGFAYSEGNRSQGQQVPRWTHPHAEIALRPPPAEYMQVTAVLDGCRPWPIAPAPVTLHLDGTPVLTDTPCPPRAYALLLPPRDTTLALDTPGWDPLAAGIDREDGPLGVRLHDLRATANGEPLTVHGALVPVPPLPPGAGPVTIREWVSDYRYGHWDFWWWYLAHAGFPALPSRLLAALWLAVALGLLLWGGYQLRASTRPLPLGTRPHISRQEPVA